MQIQEITSLIEKRDSKRVLLLCHHNADPDAICSAFAFSQLLKRLCPEIDVEIAAAQGPSKLSKFVLKAFPMALTEHPNIEETDIIVLLDTNTVQQLDEWCERVKASKASIIVIDHHASHPETERLATITVADETASSTCEIIYRLFKEAKVRPSLIEAKALFIGIAFDTKHFILASSATLKILADLIDVGVKAEEALSLLSLPMDLSERIARLKACKRVKLFKINDWIAAFSHVSAYQASAARALVGLGAHLAVVAGQQDEKIQISMRATREFYEKTKIHLGRDIAKPLGEYLHGMGGGHTVSAGVNGVGDVEASFKRCLKLLKAKLKEA
jgi:nanoRNase/pAp phosphatase (c-di-AMP/oligoRNAs hydrolase)